MTEKLVIWVCQRCTASAGESGKCEFCGGTKVACYPGEDGDPVRKPLIDGEGNVLTRAPVWWIQETAPELFDRSE